MIVKSNGKTAWCVYVCDGGVEKSTSYALAPSMCTVTQAISQLHGWKSMYICVFKILLFQQQKKEQVAKIFYEMLNQVYFLNPVMKNEWLWFWLVKEFQSNKVCLVMALFYQSLSSSICRSTSTFCLIIFVLTFDAPSIWEMVKRIITKPMTDFWA